MKIEKVWLTETAVWIRTDEGKEACELFADYPRLRYATKEQLVDFTTDDFGIHWEELDEDLSFEGFFEKQEPTALYQLFMAHPELNVSALARRMGISQSPNGLDSRHDPCRWARTGGGVKRGRDMIAAPSLWSFLFPY